MRRREITIVTNPVAGGLESLAAAAGGVAGVVVVEAGVAHRPQAARRVGTVPAGVAAPSLHVVHALQGHVDEARLVHVGHLSPGPPGHLVVGPGGPAVVVQDERDGVCVVGVVVGGEVEGVLPGDLAQPGVGDGDLEPVVVAGVRHSGRLRPTTSAGGGRDERGEDAEQDQHVVWPVTVPSQSYLQARIDGLR